MCFPDDVVDYILSFLQSDLYTLKQCAQSHSTLSKLSERHIYANVILCDDFFAVHHSIATSEFIKILGSRPGIAKHVRSLTIRVEPHGRMLTSEHLCGVASLLPTFSGLNDLEIKTLNGCFSWPRLPCMFHQSFLDFLRSQGKKKVWICGAKHFPLSLLDTCKNVKVTLDKCEYTQYDKGSNTKDMSLEPFEHLSLLCCSEACLESIIAWLRIRSLRSLEYRVGWCGEEPRNFLPRMIVACSNSLTNFCLDINYYFEISDDVSAMYGQNLACLCHLERLSVKAEVSSSRKSPIPAIVELILTALALPRFKEVYLEFKFGNFSSDVPGPGIWLPVVPLAAACSSLFIPIYISEKTSSAAVCEELIPYVEKGVVVMVPEIPSIE